MYFCKPKCKCIPLTVIMIINFPITVFILQPKTFV